MTILDPDGNKLHICTRLPDWVREDAWIDTLLQAAPPVSEWGRDGATSRRSYGCALWKAPGPTDGTWLARRSALSVRS